MTIEVRNTSRCVLGKAFVHVPLFVKCSMICFYSLFLFIWDLWKAERYICNYLPVLFIDYKGCFKDQRSRTLNEKKKVSSSMTVDYCKKKCTDGKFKYYGVEVIKIRIYFLSGIIGHQ